MNLFFGLFLLAIICKVRSTSVFLYLMIQQPIAIVCFIEETEWLKKLAQGHVVWDVDWTWSQCKVQVFVSL